ncbi:Tetratricopeptide repeat protein [Candidatus Koribacter versatilis Ellin345]|uniref:Tetratricopeptide repeat protein n=1 Tax=Koribacter versatilis (strain Ellin345) TaxID=204669 RepID=Q1ITQ9_KORVE|nr:tetratricopeptide repeat protein [Candidatus Koribacter versatilis]ABF39741.1 Tetratricopeptide repeat protein [Candidatus Koribacter versatilis Ellin345]
MSATAQAVVTAPITAKTWVMRIFCAVFGAALILGCLEGALRVFDVGFPTSLTVPCTMEQQPAACYNLFFTAPYFPPGIIHTPTLFAVPAVKAQNTYRIFVLGESAAMGDPDPAYGFSRYLEVMLRNRYPQMRFEVMNTGTVAINSHVGLPIAREIAKLKPDVVIIYSGNNEVVGPYGAGTAFAASAMELPAIRSSIWYHTTRTGQLLTKLGMQKLEWRGMEMFLDKQVPQSSPLMPYVYANFEANLRDTIGVLRGAGATAIVSTVATNLRDCAPFSSLHRAGLSKEALQRWDTLVNEGAKLEEAGAHSEALKLYAQTLAIDDEYAELEFRIARVQLALGKREEALKHFERARDLDTLRFRADSRINAINRSTAESGGAELVDAEQLLYANAVDGITGGDLIYEHVHLTPTGNYLLARAMFLKIAGKLSPTAGEADVPSESECEEWLALTGHDRIRIAHEMAERLQKPPFTNQSNHSEQLLRISMQAQQADESPQDTAAQYQRALQQAPNDHLLHYGFGRFLFRYNPDAGANELRQSRPWDGFPVFAPNGQIF